MNTYRVDDFWDKMTGAYGTQWTSKYGDHDSSGIWQSALRKFHDTQVKEAIARAATFYKDFPPSLGEFLALCREAKRPIEHFQLEHKPEPLTHQQRQTWVQKLSGMMEKAKAAPPMTEAEREHHRQVLGWDKEERAKDYHFSVAGTRNACAYPNCNRPGAISDSTNGARQWFCANHFSGMRAK